MIILLPHRIYSNTNIWFCPVSTRFPQCFLTFLNILKIQSLGNLQSIGRGAKFENSRVQSLGNLQSIGGNAFFGDSQIQSLGNLQSIGGDAHFIDSQIQSLGNLQSIGGSAYIEMSPLRKKDFESIKVGGIFIGS